MENLEKLYKKDIEKAKQFKVNDVVRLSRRGLEFFNKKAIYNRRFGIVLSKIEDKPWCLKIQWEGLKNPEILSAAYLEKNRPFRRVSIIYTQRATPMLRKTLPIQSSRSQL